MRISRLILALAASTLLITACSTQKKPATEALAAIEASLASVKDDAAHYAPDGLKGVESTLGMLKDSLAKEDYKTVLAGTPELAKAVDSLKGAIEAGKERAASAIAEWNQLRADVPKMVEAIQSRVDILSKSRKLPKNVSKDDFESAKSGLDSMKATWGEATAAFASGDPGAASDKAHEVKAKGEEILRKLGMTSA
jgi:uncharacterized protein YoxC